MKKRITLLLSLLLCLFVTFGVGCSSYYQTGGGGDLSNSTTDSSSGEEKPQGDAYSVTLKTTDGGSLPSLSGVYAQWTEINGANVYRAPFDEEGVATSYKPDGEYQVTLSTTPTGYTYDPNIYFADNTANDEIIELYPLRGLSGGDGSNVYEQVYKINTTGAYRFTFESSSDAFFFTFGAAYSGKMTFRSLLDVTANEVLPVFYEWIWSVNKPGPAVVGGAAENSYTKNFYHEVELSNSQSQSFKIGVETVNEKAFPISIDVLIQKEGEYTQSGISLQMVPPPTNLIDYSEEMPTGAFTVLADTNGKLLDESMVVYDETDDRYYLKDSEGNADKSKMLYAMLKKDVPGLTSGAGLSYAEVRHTSYETGKNYTQFINAHFMAANKDGSYPVTAALKEYLYDFSVKTPMFFDGKGSAEGDGYQVATIHSQWLFACGYYE